MARMTPGNFVPLDVNYPRDGAIRRAGEHAELLFLRSLAYCKGAKTGGFVPDFDLEVVAVGLRNLAPRVEKLVAEQLWVEVLGGWQIRSWERWNGGDSAFREERSASGKHGNHVRWHVKQGIVDPACPECSAGVQAPSDDGSDSGQRSLSESLSDPGANRKGREGKGRTNSSSADADGAFAEFWSLYPRKVGKQAARRVWDRKIRDADPAAIVAGLRAYLPVYAKADEQFIPHPSTWLQRGSWEDEIKAGDSLEDLPHYWRGQGGGESA